jgi:Co/Zn/Cd efflux system component
MLLSFIGEVMGANCCGNGLDVKINEVNKKFKSALWIALILNFSMFILENINGLLSHSLSLRADAIDFLGDSANYFITLFVLNSALKTKAKVSFLKALFMFGFGVWVLFEAFTRFYSNAVPDSFTMSWVGLLALIINGFVALILYKFKDGDSNMQSVWLCSRNDAIGNLAVIAASFGVHYLSSKWPDLIVAIFMASLSVSASFKVLIVVKKEFQESKFPV